MERGYKITKKDLLDFIAELIKGDKNDKDYQRKIIDNLVTQVFVSDDDTVVYFNIRGGKNIKTLNFEDVKSSISSLKSVQTQLPLAHFRIEILNHMAQHSEGTLFGSNFYWQVRIENSNFLEAKSARSLVGSMMSHRFWLTI